MDVDEDRAFQERDWQIFFFSGQTVRSVRTKNNVLQGNLEIYLECRTINRLMCDFISYEIYLNSKIYPEMILTRNDPYFFRVHLLISGPLRQSTAFKGIKLWKTIKNDAYGQLRYHTKH